MTLKTVRVTSFTGTASTGAIDIVDFSKAEVMRNTVLRTGTLLSLTVVGAFIPVAHFFIVPLGLIAAVVIFFRTSSTKRQIASGSAPCPACGQTVVVLKRSYSLPFKDTCEHCHREVVFSES